LIFPSREWRVRIYTLLSFFMFDYMMTGVFCRAYTDEGDWLLRSFMIYFNSIPLGILALTLSFCVPIYALLCYLTNRDWRSLREIGIIDLVAEHKNPIFDIVFGLGAASRHFEGAMSWILPLSNRLWLVLGFILYLIIVWWGGLGASYG